MMMVIQVALGVMLGGITLSGLYVIFMEPISALIMKKTMKVTTAAMKAVMEENF